MKQLFGGVGEIAYDDALLYTLIIALLSVVAFELCLILLKFYFACWIRFTSILLKIAVSDAELSESNLQSRDIYYRF